MDIESHNIESQNSEQEQTIDATIVPFVYTMDDGQVIEVYESVGLPFPLVLAQSTAVPVANDAPVLDSEDQQEQTSEGQETEYSPEGDLETIILQLVDINDDLRETNNNITSCFLFMSAIMGIFLGFFTAKELLKIWLI